MDAVAEDATIIRKGVDWYKALYNGGGAWLDLDILLSEFGMAWELIGDNDDISWSGGWPGFRKGLSWWNAYLCWLTRLAPSECKLKDWDIASKAHTLHACVMAPESEPIATRNTPNDQRNQWFFDSDRWRKTTTYQFSSIKLATLPVEQIPHGHIRENSFTANDFIPWGNPNEYNWRRTPLGACYSVWAQVGPEDLTGNLSSGWVESVNGGVVGTANVNLPAGYSTVYFPIMKDLGTFDPYTQFFMRWLREDGGQCDQGYMGTTDFEDSRTITKNGYNQKTYSAMVFPVVCFASSPRAVTVQLSRNIGGPKAWLGRPVVLSGACSWFIIH